MSGPRFTRRPIPEALANADHWPTVDSNLLDEVDRKRFLKYHDAISRYLNNECCTAFLPSLKLTHGELLRQINRCLRPAQDGKIHGWRALIPNFHIATYGAAALETPGGKKGTKGHAGKLSALLRKYRV